MMESKKQVAINLIKDEIKAQGVITRKKAMKLYMDKLGEKEMNGSINSAVTGAISFLIKNNFMVAKEKGLYTKI